MSDYSYLKTCATKATAGPWDAVDDEDSAAGAIFIMPVFDQWVPPICRITSERDAIYVAEANPAVILELLAENESLRADAERYRWLTDGKRGDYCWNNVLSDCDRDLGDYLDDAIDAAISSPENP